MNEIELHKLPVRPYPFEDEGVKGYLFRLSVQNGLDRLSYTVIPRINPKLDELAILLGRDDREFWMKHPEAAYWDNHCLMDASIWDWKQRKYCPICLQENAYWRFEWELPDLNTCSRHGIRLVDRCAQCGKKLHWRSYGLTHCDCGHDLRSIEIEPATENEIILSRNFVASLGVPNNWARLRFIRHLSPLQLLKLVRYLGNLDANPLLSTTRVRGISQVGSAFANAANYMVDWPANYHRHLSKLRSAALLETNPASLNQIFGRTYERLFIELVGPEFQFVRDAFEQYIQSNWRWYLCSRNQRISEETRSRMEWIPAAQAARELQVRASTIKEMVALKKMAGYTNVTVTGRSQVVIHVDEIRKWKLHSSDMSTLTDASAILGISDKRLLELVESNVISPISRPESGKSGQWQFSKVSLTKLLDIAGNAPICDANDIARYITVRGLFRSWKRGENSFPKLINAVAEKKLRVAGQYKSGRGISRWLFDRSDYRKWRGVDFDFDSDGSANSFNAQQVSQLLAIKEEVAYQLIRNKIVKSEIKYQNGKRISIVKEEELIEFKRRFVFNSHIAQQLEIQPRDLLEKLTRLGVRPHFPVGKGKLRQAIYERNPKLDRSLERIVTYVNNLKHCGATRPA